MKFLYLVYSSLKRKKLRTVLTFLSVFVAFLLFGLLCTIKEAFAGGGNAPGIDRLIVRHRISLIMTLPVNYEARIAQVPGVAAVQHWSWFGGLYQNDAKNFFASFPVNPEPWLEMYPEYLLSDDQKKAWLSTRTGAIVGKSLAERFKWKIGDRIPITSPIWPRPNDEAWEFDIVGIYDGAKKSTDTNGLFFRYDYFDEARARDKGMVGWYVVRVSDPNNATEVAKLIDQEFANSPYETKAETEAAFTQGFAQQIGNIGAILIAILSAVFFTILLVSGNTMAQAVRERTQEIGVLKSMGFTNELVLVLVLAESVMVATSAGLGGLLVSWLITLGGSPVPNVLPVFVLPMEYLLIGAAMALFVGLISGVVPAVSAMRLQIATALRRNA